MNKFLIVTILSLLAFSTMADFASDCLDAHNPFREELDIEPLSYSLELEVTAQKWAENLAQMNTLQHSQDRENIGENLAMGTKGIYNTTRLIELWSNEKKYYKHSEFPNVSTTGNWQDVGHYTQMIWKNTQEVGCAQVDNERSSFIVCHYKPSGNWVGEFAY